MKHKIASIIHWLIGCASCTTPTETIVISGPGIMGRVVEAWSVGNGWTPRSNLTKTRYAMSSIRSVVLKQITNHETLVSQRGWVQDGTDSIAIQD